MSEHGLGQSPQLAHMLLPAIEAPLEPAVDKQVAARLAVRRGLDVVGRAITQLQLDVVDPEPAANRRTHDQFVVAVPRFSRGERAAVTPPVVRALWRLEQRRVRGVPARVDDEHAAVRAVVPAFAGQAPHLETLSFHPCGKRVAFAGSELEFQLSEGQQLRHAAHLHRLAGPASSSVHHAESAHGLHVGNTPRAKERDTLAPQTGVGSDRGKRLLPRRHTRQVGPQQLVVNCAVDPVFAEKASPVRGQIGLGIAQLRESLVDEPALPRGAPAARGRSVGLPRMADHCVAVRQDGPLEELPVVAIPHGRTLPLQVLHHVHKNLRHGTHGHLPQRHWACAVHGQPVLACGDVSHRLAALARQRQNRLRSAVKQQANRPAPLLCNGTDVHPPRRRATESQAPKRTLAFSALDADRVRAGQFRHKRVEPARAGRERTGDGECRNADETIAHQRPPHGWRPRSRRRKAGDEATSAACSGCHPQACLRVLLWPAAQHPQTSLWVAPDFLDGLPRHVTVPTQTRLGLAQWSALVVL